MDKESLLSKIGYLKSELYKPSLRPYYTAIVDVCDALEALIQEAFKPSVDGLTISRGTDTGMKRRSASTPSIGLQAKQVDKARRLKAERQARWRAKHKAQLEAQYDREHPK